MQKNSALGFARIVVTTALIAYVFHNAGLFSIKGWQDLFDTFAHVRLLFVLASIVVGLLLSLSSTLKWYMLLHSRGLLINFWRLFAYYMIGKFFNLVLPTSMGGDVVRMHALGRHTERYADSVASVFVERLSGKVTLVVLALLAVVVNLHLFNLPWLTAGLSLGAAGVAFICWLIIDERPFKLGQRLCGKRVLLLPQLVAKSEKFRQAVLAYRNDPAALWGALINSLIFHFLAVVNVWVSLLAFGSDFSFVSALVVTPVILFIMNMPFSIGGIGLMEFAYCFTLGLFGATPALGISTALLMRTKSLIEAGIGGLLYPLVGEGRINSRPKVGSSRYREYPDE